MPEKSNGNGRWFSRRLWSTIVWAILINAAFLICLSLENGLAWFAEYGKLMTFGLVFLVSGLTLTDMLISTSRRKVGEGNE